MSGLSVPCWLIASTFSVTSVAALAFVGVNVLLLLAVALAVSMGLAFDPEADP